MQECHPLSIWNYLILLGDSNKNNNNKDLQLGSGPSRYLQMFSSVSAEGITPACSQNREHFLSSTASVLFLAHRSGYGEPQTILIFFVDARTPSKGTESYRTPQPKFTGIQNLPELVCPSSQLTPIPKIHGTLTLTFTGCSE